MAHGATLVYSYPYLGQRVCACHHENPCLDGAELDQVVIREEWRPGPDDRPMPKLTAEPGRPVVKSSI